MNTFSYHTPENLQQAFEIFSIFTNKARLLAGGTDLLVRIKNNQVIPEAVINIKNIKELNAEISISGSEVRIGALTLLSSIASNEIITQHFPALAEAAESIGSVQIRNRATCGGNLCNASPAADTAPPLLVYGAKIEIVGQKTTRILPLEEFILGPGKTALAYDEILESIIIPIPSDKQAASFSRLTRRRGVDLATINVCCQVHASGLTRFAVGAAAPVPFIIQEPKGLLADPGLDHKEKINIIHQIMTKAAPITDIRASQEYRQEMIVVLAMRTLNQSIERLRRSTKE